ncbi:MAG TPA: alpha/beta hydrolase [Syntrophales bacterium]|nr:alpha/beta hydrolase [Syntrophales bacterium]
MTVEREDNGIELSFREESVGGAVKRPDNEASILLSPRLLLLVHGFNVSAREAAETYDGFTEMQRTILGRTEGRYCEDRLVVRILWPGDADWGIASPLFYPWSIGRANQTAEVLAESLCRACRSGLLFEVDIIAHSLGCRLALETIRCLQVKAGPRPAVRRIVLMAGAVPTFMLDEDPGARLRRAYDEILRDPAPALSLYSGRDGVLSWAFPLGETAAGGKEFLPTALGHEAWRHRGAPANLLQREIENAGHSDYWGHRREVNWSPPLKAGRLARSFLGLAPPLPREVEEWRPAERDTAESRPCTAARERIERTT